MNNGIQEDEFEYSKKELQEIRLLCEDLSQEDPNLIKELDSLEEKLKKKEEIDIFEKKIEEFCRKVEELENFECEPGKQEELKEKLKVLDKEIEEIEKFIEAPNNNIQDILRNVAGLFSKLRLK